MKDPAARQEAVRNFRFGLIAPVVTRTVTAAERNALLREMVKGEYQTPWGRSWRPNIETLRRYVTAYEKGGLAALTPAPRDDRGKSRAIPPELLTEAVALRREVPTRSVQQVIDILVLAGRCRPGELKRSTLHDHLERAGAGKRAMKDLLRQNQAVRRFAASHRNEIWMGDCQHTLHLPDPDAPERRRQVYLLAFLDDFSRLMPHAEFYWQERLPKLEDCLKKAILRCGAPQTLYVDNGSIYVADQLQRICGELCIELVHSRPGRPQGRGKLEKWFQLVDRSFLPEALPLIDKGQLRTLDQLNELFWAWLEVGYHQRLHTQPRPRPASVMTTTPPPSAASRWTACVRSSSGRNTARWTRPVASASAVIPTRRTRPSPARKSRCGSTPSTSPSSRSGTTGGA